MYIKSVAIASSSRLYKLALMAFFAVTLLCANLHAAGGGGGGGGGGRGGGGGGRGGGGGGPGGGGGGGGPGGGGGGGNGPGNHDPNQDKDVIGWADSDEAAVSGAAGGKSGPLAVMVAVIRPNNAEDLAVLKKIGSWPSVVAIAKIKFVAGKVLSDSASGQELIKKLGAKIVPGIVWEDHYGNAIYTQPLPDAAEQITNVVLNWPGTLAIIDRFFKEHQAKADAYFAKGKLRSAYVEYGFGAPFKGPEAEKAKLGQTKIKEAWLKMAAAALQFDANSPGRVAIEKGLRTDTARLDIAKQIEEALKGAVAVAGADANGNAPETPKPVDTAAAAPKLPEKGLADVAKSRAADTPTEAAETGSFDLGALAAYTDPRIKQAGEGLTRGSDAFKKAIADSMERGETRNALLKSAHTDFTKAIALLEEVPAAKADGAVQKLTEKVSMMIYACLKLQTL